MNRKNDTIMNLAPRLLIDVKHDLARLLLRWGTTLESLVFFFCFHFREVPSVDLSLLKILLVSVDR